MLQQSGDCRRTCRSSTLLLQVQHQAPKPGYLYQQRYHPGLLERCRNGKRNAILDWPGASRLHPFRPLQKRGSFFEPGLPNSGCRCMIAARILSPHARSFTKSFKGGLNSVAAQSGLVHSYKASILSSHTSLRGVGPLPGQDTLLPLCRSGSEVPLESSEP